MKKFLMGCITLLMTFALGSCSIISFFLGLYEEEREVSLEYTLTEDDLKEFGELAAKFEEYALVGTNVLRINMSYTEMMDKYEYIEAQAFVGYIEYCLDQTNELAMAHYTESEALMSDARARYLEMLKKLAQESPIKDELFAGFTEKDWAFLLADNTKISELQLANSELTRDFYALEEGAGWSGNVNALYEEFVENNQQMAQVYGYDNYYEFASEEIYGNAYTAEQRADFRAYVAEYILPLYVRVSKESDVAYAALSEEQKNAYSVVYSDFDRLYGYMDSFDGDMNAKMNAMFERPNAAIFADGENALQGAFVSYVNYYDQPVAYFGPGYQDVFTVVHEMGHYVAYYYFDDSLLPYDLAETHSQGNEWTFLSYLEECVDAEVYEALYLDRAATGLSRILYSTLVDHFEELVYTATMPIAADGFEPLMASVCKQYEGLEAVLATGLKYSPFEYVQHVVIPSPVYYLNYATSELASMGFFVLAQEKGYASAQEAYALLQEGVDPEADFLTAIEEAGLFSPFAEQTYVDLEKVFLAE